MSAPISNRYDFVYFFDVQNGNPNGDPDAGNMPRIDAETGRGFVTDVCLKRKIRDYVEAVYEDEKGFALYIREGTILGQTCQEALDSLGKSRGREFQSNNPEMVREAVDKGVLTEDDVIRFMCEEYYDVRTFGAVMTEFTKKEGKNLKYGLRHCGQVRGPVQLTFAQSIDPIDCQGVALTRVCKANDERAEQAGGSEFGNKWIVPYALYRCEGFVSANLARKTTGFSEDDLEVLWDALANMFDFDRSAARGLMSPRALVVFKHDSELGNAPAHKLLEAVSVTRKEGVPVPRSFADYGEVVVDRAQVPEGVEVIRKF